jgi:hypothetical protein
LKNLFSTHTRARGLLVERDEKKMALCMSMCASTEDLLKRHLLDFRFVQWCECLSNIEASLSFRECFFVHEFDTQERASEQREIACECIRLLEIIHKFIIIFLLPNIKYDWLLLHR